MKSKYTAKGAARIAYATRYSLAGLKTAFRDEAAFRQICVLFCISIILSCLFASSWQEGILLILPAFICMVVELINTAIENIVDLVSPQWNELAKKAKDLGSAAQLLSQIFLFVVWFCFILSCYF